MHLYLAFLFIEVNSEYKVAHITVLWPIGSFIAVAFLTGKQTKPQNPNLTINNYPSNRVKTTEKASSNRYAKSPTNP